jgi:hypothetical protein
MPPVEFEPTISVGERPQTYVWDRAAIRTGYTSYFKEQNQITVGQYLWGLNFIELLCLLLYGVRYHIGTTKVLEPFDSSGNT